MDTKCESVKVITPDSKVNECECCAELYTLIADLEAANPDSGVCITADIDARGLTLVLELATLT